MAQVLAGGAVHDDHATVAITVGDERFVGLGIDPDARGAAEQLLVGAAANLVELADGEHKLAGARELHHAVMRVAADPHEVVVIDKDAVRVLRELRHVLGGRIAPALNELTLLVELEDHGCRCAAGAHGRLLHLVELFFGQGLGQVGDPDVLLGVDEHASHGAENPVIRQFKRPRGIDLEARRRRLGLGFGNVAT